MNSYKLRIIIVLNFDGSVLFWNLRIGLRISLMWKSQALYFFAKLVCTVYLQDYVLSTTSPYFMLVVQNRKVQNEVYFFLYKESKM